VDLVSQPEKVANEEREHFGPAPDIEDSRYATETGSTVGDVNESQEAIKQPEERIVTSIVNIKRNAGSALKAAATTRKWRRNAPKTHEQLVSPRVKVEVIAGRDMKEDGNVSNGRDGSTHSKSSLESKLPRFSVGTRFLKEFPGHGMFQGTIKSFDGEHYRVYYPYGGDAENLSDFELDEVEIIETPTSRSVTLDKIGSSSQGSNWCEQHRPCKSITKSGFEVSVDWRDKG
jgi:hypothetical protein